MNERIYGLFGTGGCARGILPLARSQFPGARIVLVEDQPVTRVCNGHDVLPFDEFAREAGAVIAVAIADPATRRKLVGRCREANLPFLTIRGEPHLVMDDVEVGEGCLFSPFTTLASNIRIGDHFHCNLYSYVEHDCRIGDFVTFAPAVCCNGNVKIGDGAYIGSNAVIRQGISIGDGAVVGAGAVVVSDLPPHTVFAGNPAVPLQR